MTAKRPVRVRVAPSPTGDPHVGTAYIALFNMAFAKSQGGRFVLRIEDTDQVRSTRESEAAIFRSLKWVGLTWDEGPDVGGDYGPYRQSERAETYREHADILLAQGEAYRCFCTSERLKEMRQQQRESGGAGGYDRKCRPLDPTDAEKRASGGEAHVVRLKMSTDGETVFEDALRGTIRYPNSQMDDQVLLKSDGMPTYHLANVVDDHLMEISHVIRAEEWIPSTPKHLRLYEAFQWDPPVFVHLSLLRNTDKSKISKRRNPVSLEWYEEAGILPEALCNFLGLMGWSMTDDREQFTLEEMVAEFEMERLKVTGPVFDLQKLQWLNGQWLRSLSDEHLSEHILSFIGGERLTRLVPLVRERLSRLDDFSDMTSYFYQMDVPFEPETLKIKRWPTKEQDGEDPRAPLRAMRKALAEILEHIEAQPSMVATALEEYHREFCERTGWKTKELFMTVRLVVTGRKASPPLFETMEVLGKARVQYRFRQAIEAIRSHIK